VNDRIGEQIRKVKEKIEADIGERIDEKEKA
jgi:hypothetical protein